MASWITVAKGVRCKEHPTRKHNSRPDRYFEIQYKRKGKVYNEVMGWESEGVTRAKCERILSVLRENWRTGEGGQTHKEMVQLKLDAQKTKRKQADEQASHTLHFIFENGYLGYCLAKQKSKSAISAETGLMNNHIRPFFGDTPIYDVDADKLDDFVAHLQTKISERTHKPLSNQSIKHALNLVSQIFGYVRSHRKSTIEIENPVKDVAKPKTAAAQRNRWLKESEAKLLLDALKPRSVDTHDMAILGLFCGLRAGEVLSLKWADIDFQEQALILKDTKNGESRFAYMTPEVEGMLRRRYMEQSLDECVFLGTTISSTFDRVVDEIGLNAGRTDSRDRVVFHSLRHTFASWHAKRGTPLYTISKLLGHKSIMMTQRYAHLCPSAEKQAVMALSGALDEKRSATVIEFEKFRAQGGA